MQKRSTTVAAVIAAVAVALGGAVVVAATTATTTATAGSEALVSLTATVACDPLDPAQSTITWTVWNKRPFEATIASVEGSSENSAAFEAVGTGIPALGSDAPGSTTFVQTVVGEHSADLSVSAHWRMDDRTLSTDTLTVTGEDCRR